MRKRPAIPRPDSNRMSSASGIYEEIGVYRNTMNSIDIENIQMSSKRAVRKYSDSSNTSSESYEPRSDSSVYEMNENSIQMQRIEKPKFYLSPDVASSGSSIDSEYDEHM